MFRTTENKPLKRLINSKRGFTLVEAVISLTVFAFVVVIFCGAIVMAEKTSHVNGQYAQALSLCQHKIDQMRAVGHGRLNYTELNDAGIVDDVPSSQPFAFNTMDTVSDYLPAPTTQVTVVDQTSKIRVVTVTCTWKPVKFKNKTSSVTLVAQIANND